MSLKNFLSANPDRAVVLACALMAIASCFISGCAVFETPKFCVDLGDGLCWYKDDALLVAPNIVFDTHDAETASRECRYGKPYKFASCTLPIVRGSDVCVILSALTKQQAAVAPSEHPRKDFVFVSILEHEARHCAGWNHTRDSAAPIL